MQVRLFITQAFDSFRFINQSVKEQLHSIEHLIIGNTTYKVRVYLSETAKETMEDKSSD